MSKIWGIPSSYKSGPQKTLFWGTSQLIGNFNGLYLRNETHDIDNRSSAFSTRVYNVRVSYIVPKCHELWSTNGFKLDLHFYPPYVNSSFYVIARLRRRRSANITQPHFTKRRTINRANNLLLNSWGRSPGKMEAKKLLHLFDFSTTSTLNSEYLLN